MSAILMAGRKRAINQKVKKVIRKAGCSAASHTLSHKLGELTASWTVPVGGKDLKISFSRDSLDVLIDGVCVDCAAYLSDSGYDLDLLFDVDGHRGHIFSDVEATEMTNYLFLDDELVARNSIKDCISKHKPNKSGTKG